MPNKQYLVASLLLFLLLASSCDRKKTELLRKDAIKAQTQGFNTVSDTSSLKPAQKEGEDEDGMRSKFTNDVAASEINEEQPTPAWGGMGDGSNPGFPPGFGPGGPPVPIPTDDEFGDLLDIGDDELGAKLPFARGLCGNCRINFKEQCDDCNLDNEDGCNILCTFPYCGNGITDLGEDCDLGVDIDGANNNTADSKLCNERCQSVRCGNCKTETAEGEACDDCNHIDGDGCSSCCQFEICGNGIVDPTEQCDNGEGLNTNGSGCSPCCQLEICGNGIVTPNEECDDANPANTGCCKDCKLTCSCPTP